FEEKKKRNYFRREFSSNTRNFSTLFDALINIIQKEGYSILKDDRDSNKLLFSKNRFNQYWIELSDNNSPNLYEVEVWKKTTSLSLHLSEWFTQTFLRMKRGLWVLLLLIISIIIPTYFLIRSNSSNVRVLGIVIFSIGLGSVFIYTGLNNLYRKRKRSRKEYIEKFLDKIIALISVFTDDLEDELRCWKCFQSVHKDNKKCPNCGSKLK
ncbi:MAG: hypothetical protein KAS95_04420, partial [Candidatus Heimdallarchaeota archaeon]|nr:hypothetical protein [Candidatus Heimdallarchaeota archaeon]